jgi:hypothetical protein
MTIINLISGPRNISTALMYSFAQRSDTVVFDEPFYAVYLNRSGVYHPGKEEVLAAQSTSEEEVRQQLFTEKSKPVVFIKNMAHHIELLNEEFLAQVTNLFLIRDPKEIIASYAQVIEKPVMRDIGLAYQHDLFFRLRGLGQEPVVIDSGLLLQNPEKILREACTRLGLDFSPAMLQWEAGPKPYDGVWAPHWYANVHRSTGFQKASSTARSLPLELAELHAKAHDYYQKLLPFSLKP